MRSRNAPVRSDAFKRNSGLSEFLGRFRYFGVAVNYTQRVRPGVNTLLTCKFTVVVQLLTPIHIAARTRI